MTLNLDHYSGCSDPDQEFIYFMGSKTLPSTCYILSAESSIPFYSTNNGYNKRNHVNKINCTFNLSYLKRGWLFILCAAKHIYFVNKSDIFRI